MSDHTSTKSFDIPKSWVWQAYLKVKSNKGSAGADGVDLDAFEEKVGPNLYKIWNVSDPELASIDFYRVN